MMKKILFVLSMIFACSVVTAQTTTVTAAVIDTDGQSWNNGIWTLAFAPSPSNPNINAYNINGVPLDPTVLTQKGTMNGAGTLSFVVYQNGAITPSGSQWTLTVCPNSITKCGTLTFNTGLLSSLNVSSSVNAVIQAPRFLAISGTYGYLDVEASIQLVPGSTYYNVTTGCQRVWSGSAWGCSSTGSGVYLPLAGGTLTGPFVGTTGQFGTSVFLGDGTIDASVVAFGAFCDGTHDDTTAIQSAMSYTASHHVLLTLPATLTNCKISSPLTVPVFLRFLGQCRTCSIIQQATDNTPIFVASTSSNSIEIGQMTIQWANQQTTSNTLSYGIEWTNNGSFFRWSVHDMQIIGAYVGEGILSTGGHKESVWNGHFSDTLIAKTAHSCMSLVPSGAVGMPVNILTNWSCNNTGDGPTPDGAAIALRSVEMDITGLDVEGWKDDVVNSSGGGYVNIHGCHDENGTLSASGRFFFIANGPMSIEGCHIALTGPQTFTTAQIVAVSSGGDIKLHNTIVDITVSAGQLYWSTSGNPKSVDFLNLTDTSGTINTSLPALSSIVEWPDVYPSLIQNQTTSQLVRMGNPNNGSVSGYKMDLGPNSNTPGTIYYTEASSNNWHVNWLFPDSSSSWHLQKCADVAGSSAGPPTTLPTSCVDKLVIDTNGNLGLGAASCTAGAFVKGDLTGCSSVIGSVADVNISIGAFTIPANSCYGSAILTTTPATVTMTNLTTAMVVLPGYTGNATAINGWGTSGGLNLIAWPSAANTASYCVNNPTSSPIAGGAITLRLAAQ